MNIKITHNWLLEYLETKATPEEIQKYLSLCGPSVESVTKVADDYIYDIEITSNRIDTASVIGIAKEACAILNRFGIKSKLKNVIVPKPTNLNNLLPLTITDDNKLCFRVVSVVMDNVAIKSSSQYIKDRLEAVGIRSLNNIIDITNYVMIEYGHPTHVMDYDRIKTGKLIIRRAKKGETSVTLDGNKHNLNEQDVIADDGTGRIVDLLGIMGCENSVVTPKTKRVVLFIESNNPHIIRHTSMKLGIRTLAATYDEKQVDSELTGIAFNRLIQLFKELTEAKIASKLIDIYHEPKKPKSVSMKESDIERLIGVKIPKKESIEILSNLGFTLISDEKDILTFKVPSYRSHDINIKEDLIEEITRIHGYNNLPNNLQPAVYVKQPKAFEQLFILQSKIKYFLKHIGLHEVMDYSMISKEMIENNDLKVKNHLSLKNTISDEIKYMRIHLMPSLIKNIKDNEGKKDVLKFFEIAKTYKPRKNDLPIEEYKLGIATNTSYSDLKGIIEALFRELNISDYQIEKTDHPLLNPNMRAKLTIATDRIGEFGQLKNEYKIKNKVKSDVLLAVFDFKKLIKHSRQLATYHPINPFAIIKLDLTLEQKKPYEEIKSIAFKTSKLLTDIEFVTLYKNNLSLRFYFSSTERNITEEEAKEELKKIEKAVRTTKK
jgi:phenylalanyl-tRNA synthetase beta chain